MSANLKGQDIHFQTIDLSELQNNKLLSRFDRKYVIPIECIPEILSIAQNHYDLK
jgi:hypothetical protein